MKSSKIIIPLFLIFNSLLSVAQQKKKSALKGFGIEVGIGYNTMIDKLGYDMTFPVQIKE